MYIIILIGVCILVNASEALVYWEHAKISAREGENITLTCTATDLDFLTVIRIQLIASDGSLQTVAESSSVKIPFSQLSRYAFSYSYHDDVGIMIMSYKGIQGEDAGSLLCKKLGSNDTTAEMKLEVQVPISDVYIVSLFDGIAIRHNDTFGYLRLRETVDQGIGCMALIEGNPITTPNLQVVIDDVDITEHFVALDTSETLMRRPNSIVTPIRHSYSLLYETMKPERHFNQQTLTCFASVNGCGPVTASATIAVEYIPVITCLQYEHFYKVTDTVVIICNVEANPSSLVSLVAANRMLNTDIMISEKVISTDTVEMQIFIPVLKQSHFGTYYLNAKNDVGVTEVTFILYDTSHIIDKSLSIKEYYLHLQPHAQPLSSEEISSQSDGNCRILATNALSVVLTVLICCINYFNA